MSSKRNTIETFRDMLKERNADSTYTNKFLYEVLTKHAKWLIRREVAAGRIYVNNSIFQTLSCIEVIETSPIDPCCPIKVNCKIYRTKNKLPEMWVDNTGPIIKTVTSVDGSTDFFYTTAMAWTSIKDDPYQKRLKQYYSFFSDGYIWIPEVNPHRINIYGFYTDDISTKNECKEEKPCVRFLDTEFMLPPWLESEMFAKALEQVAGVTKRLPEDEDINKNPTRKN